MTSQITTQTRSSKSRSARPEGNRSRSRCVSRSRLGVVLSNDGSSEKESQPRPSASESFDPNQAREVPGFPIQAPGGQTRRPWSDDVSGCGRTLWLAASREPLARARVGRWAGLAYTHGGDAILPCHDCSGLTAAAHPVDCTHPTRRSADPARSRPDKEAALSGGLCGRAASVHRDCLDSSECDVRCSMTETAACPANRSERAPQPPPETKQPHAIHPLTHSLPLTSTPE